jgi:hypothetical protein
MYRAYMIETKEDILKALNSPLADALASNNITPSRVANKLSQMLDAKEKKHFAFQGKVGDEVELEALDIQLKAADLSAKLLDIYPAERHRFEGEIIEKRSPEELTALREIAQGVAEALRHNVKHNDSKG